VFAAISEVDWPKVNTNIQEHTLPFTDETAASGGGDPETCK